MIERHNANFPQIVSGYTISSHIGDYYKRATARLAKSCVKFELPFLTYPMNRQCGWDAGCSLKTTIILDSLKRFDRPILWLDADAQIFQYPKVFDDIDAEMGLCSSSGHWLTGTLYFTPSAIPFVERWHEAMKNPKDVDEVVLLHKYNSDDNRPKLRILPKMYNIDIHTKTDFTDVVIGHHMRTDIAPCRGVVCNEPEQL